MLNRKYVMQKSENKIPSYIVHFEDLCVYTKQALSADYDDQKSNLNSHS